eukprot:3914076-Rhodomonas_salina.1
MPLYLSNTSLFWCQNASRHCSARSLPSLKRERVAMYAIPSIAAWQQHPRSWCWTQRSGHSVTRGKLPALRERSR